VANDPVGALRLDRPVSITLSGPGGGCWAVTVGGDADYGARFLDAVNVV
jgi:hypothetical protein